MSSSRPCHTSWTSSAELHSVSIHPLPPPLGNQCVEGALPREMSPRWLTVVFMQQLLSQVMWDDSTPLASTSVVDKVQNTIHNVKLDALSRYCSAQISSFGSSFSHRNVIISRIHTSFCCSAPSEPWSTLGDGSLPRNSVIVPALTLATCVSP